MATTNTHSQFKPKGTNKQRRVLTAVYTNGNRATLAQMGIAPQTAQVMMEQGLIKRADKIVTGKKGRPALVYSCTDKGAKRAKRALGLTK